MIYKNCFSSEKQCCEQFLVWNWLDKVWFGGKTSYWSSVSVDFLESPVAEKFIFNRSWLDDWLGLIFWIWDNWEFLNESHSSILLAKSPFAHLIIWVSIWLVDRLGIVSWVWENIALNESDTGWDIVWLLLMEVDVMKILIGRLWVDILSIPLWLFIISTELLIWSLKQLNVLSL